MSAYQDQTDPLSQTLAPSRQLKPQSGKSAYLIDEREAKYLFYLRESQGDDFYALTQAGYHPKDANAARSQERKYILWKQQYTPSMSIQWVVIIRTQRNISPGRPTTHEATPTGGQAAINAARVSATIATHASMRSVSANATPMRPWNASAYPSPMSAWMAGKACATPAPRKQGSRLFRVIANKRGRENMGKSYVVPIVVYINGQPSA